MESSRERKSVPEEPEWEFAVPELIAAGDEADGGIASLPEHLTGKSSKIPCVNLAPLLPCPRVCFSSFQTSFGIYFALIL